MSDDEFTPDGARAAAERDELDDWVRRFLASPGSDNAELGHELAERTRWWAGPVRVPLDELHRLAGPEGHPVLEVVEDDEWRGDVDDLTRRIEGGLEPAPVIATHREGRLVLEDGNHRVEALRRAGIDQAWVVAGFEDRGARDRFASADGSNASTP